MIGISIKSIHHEISSERIFKFMNYSSNQKKANKILYISIVSVLCILAILIVITGASNRKKDAGSNKAETNQTSKQDETTKDSSSKKPDSMQDENTTAPKDNSHNAAAQYEDTATAGGENDIEDAVLDTEDAEPVGSTPEKESLPVFVSPVSGMISKEFSDTVLVYSLTMNDYRTHIGVDYEAEIGAPVYSAAQGVISEIWEDPMMGVCMLITHPGDAVSIYKNLSKESMSIEGIFVGADVLAGQVIASVGETSLVEQSDSPHLHYELKINDQQVNPSHYIKASDEIVYEG